ncbi:MAG: hypothetical protein FVQ80_08065 [Planctomycetes bacterium]|nr:hypothetical protein [Planctomycetota bacterium]
MRSRKLISTTGILFAVLFSMAFFVSSCKKQLPKSAEVEKADSKETETVQVTDAEPEVVAVKEEEKPQEPKVEPEKKIAMAAIRLTLPKPMFVGTPQNIRVANLQKPLGKPRPAFYAPIGTKNLAFGKSVASTDDDPIIGGIDMITDGDKKGSDGSNVELGPFIQHVTIDLESESEIYAILLWHFHKQPRVYYDVVVQVADDPDFITNVRTLFNNDHDNSAGLGVGSDLHYVETSEGKLIDAKGVKGRYVRLYSNGNSNNDLNHYVEVEVYGKVAE